MTLLLLRAGHCEWWGGCWGSNGWCPTLHGALPMPASSLVVASHLDSHHILSALCCVLLLLHCHCPTMPVSPRPLHCYMSCLVACAGHVVSCAGVAVMGAVGRIGCVLCRQPPGRQHPHCTVPPTHCALHSHRTTILFETAVPADCLPLPHP